MPPDLSAASSTTFFTDNAYLGIKPVTRTRLSDEGIDFVDDLVDFDKDAIDSIANNLRRNTVPPGPYSFGAKVQKRLKEACELVRFYKTVGRNTTLAGMNYTVIEHFTIQWSALKT